MVLSNYMLWLAILFNVLTNVGFKYAALAEKSPTKFWLIFSGSLVFGLLNSLCFTEALKSLTLNSASAVFFSLTIVSLFLMSHFVFHEAMNWKHITGTFAIVAGVVLINAA